jgi:hypothetical protein
MPIYNLYLDQEAGLHKQTSITRMQWRFIFFFERNWQEFWRSYINIGECEGSN